MTNEQKKTIQAVYGAMMISERLEGIGLPLNEDLRKKDTLQRDYALVNFGLELLVEKVFGKKNSEDMEGMNGYLEDILHLIYECGKDEEKLLKKAEEIFG